MKTELLKTIKTKIFDIDVLLATLNSRFGDKIGQYFDIDDFTNDELIMAHAILHEYNRKIPTTGLEYKQWRKEDVIYFHRKVAVELMHRAIGHEEWDDLDTY